jgi:hypothetical protein
VSAVESANWRGVILITKSNNARAACAVVICRGSNYNGLTSLVLSTKLFEWEILINCSIMQDAIS